MDQAVDARRIHRRNQRGALRRHGAEIAIGGVDYEAATGDRRARLFGVVEIAGDEIGTTGRRFAHARADAEAGCAQRRRQRRADKAARAGDENFGMRRRFGHRANFRMSGALAWARCALRVWNMALANRLTSVA